MKPTKERIRIFQETVRGLHWQLWQPATVDDGRWLETPKSCRYTTKEGLMCAIGVHMTVEDAQKAEDMAVGSVAELNEIGVWTNLFPSWVETDNAFAAKLQELHDDDSAKDTTLRSRFEDFAILHNYPWPEECGPLPELTHEEIEECL